MRKQLKYSHSYRFSFRFTRFPFLRSFVFHSHNSDSYGLSFLFPQFPFLRIFIPIPTIPIPTNFRSRSHNIHSYGLSFPFLRIFIPISTIPIHSDLHSHTNDSYPQGSSFPFSGFPNLETKKIHSHSRSFQWKHWEFLDNTQILNRLKTQNKKKIKLINIII